MWDSLNFLLDSMKKNLKEWNVAVGLVMKKDFYSVFPFASWKKKNRKNFWDFFSCLVFFKPWIQLIEKKKDSASKMLEIKIRFRDGEDSFKIFHLDFILKEMKLITDLLEIPLTILCLNRKLFKNKKSGWRSEARNRYQEISRNFPFFYWRIILRQTLCYLRMMILFWFRGWAFGSFWGSRNGEKKQLYIKDFCWFGDFISGLKKFNRVNL